MDENDAIAYGTNEEGECLILQYPAARYVVTVTWESANGTKFEERAPAVIPPGGTGKVEVIFDP